MVPAPDFQAILDTAPDAMVVVGTAGRIELVNVQTERLFGYARSELLGQPLEILIPEGFRGAHGGHMSRYFAQPGTRPMGSGLQLFGRRKDGSQLPIEVSLSPLRDPLGMTVSAAIRDISDRLQLEAAAKLTSDRLHSAVASIQDAIALFDAEDRLILCNDVYRSLMPAALRDGLVGRRYVDILDAWLADIELPDAGARASFRASRLAQRRAPTGATDVRMRDGRMLRVIDRPTLEGGIVKTIADVTEDERRAMELREARAIAEAASAAKSEFLSSMSHELRTPLNAILGFAQLLVRDRREPLSTRHTERVEHILRGGEHLLRLINDILDLSKIEAGMVSISLEPVSVAEVLAEVARTLEPIAARHGITLAVEAGSAMPRVLADRTRFAQILLNLGSNAIKYNRAGGSVRFVVTSGSEMTQIRVIDTGIGIPVEQHDRMFQPFQRAGQETGPVEGTGIGLVITKRLAELMGGSVGFLSHPDRGSEFWVELCISHDAAPFVANHHAQPAVARRALASHLVLYVEDNPANVEFIKDLVGSFDGVELVALPTAELGIDFARARRPDLILMDINLPGMSGLDAMRLLRANAETATIPVIALTAAAGDRERRSGEEAGFYRYLTKPVQVDELSTAIEAILTSP